MPCRTLKCFSFMTAIPMRYSMLNFPCQREISDDWRADAGVDAFPPTATTAYRLTVDAALA